MKPLGKITETKSVIAIVQRNESILRVQNIANERKEQRKSLVISRMVDARMTG
jgi:hypothetical protein